MKKLYVGCAINNLPEDKKQEFLAMIDGLKNQLRKHFEVLDFLGTASSSLENIYTRDIIECVGQADLMVAICDHPSTGLGYEMATAIEVRKIPVLAMAHYQSNVSRLILGIHGSKKKFNFVRYHSFEQIPSLIKEQFEIRAWLDHRK